MWDFILGIYFKNSKRSSRYFFIDLRLVSRGWYHYVTTASLRLRFHPRAIHASLITLLHDYDRGIALCVRSPQCNATSCELLIVLNVKKISAKQHLWSYRYKTIYNTIRDNFSRCDLMSNPTSPNRISVFVAWFINEVVLVRRTKRAINAALGVYAARLYAAGTRYAVGSRNPIAKLAACHTDACLWAQCWARYKYCALWMSSFYTRSVISDLCLDLFFVVNM